MSAEALRLEIAEFTDAHRWRWVLNDAQGAFLADHVVELHPDDPKHQTLFDLPSYLWHYAAPDKRNADERRLLEEVGAWFGGTVLGPTIGEKILAQGFPPIVVRVAVPQEAERLLVMPLEIAHVRGKPLALQGVSLVFEVLGEATPPAAPIGDRLRLLSVFSLPPEGSPLNLRRERQTIRALVRELTAAGLAIDLRVLQYGVTRTSLLDALEEGEGWDVIHFSGHGLPGSLVLENPDGQPDRISYDETAKLVRQTGKRLKLVVLSACLSAAASIQETLSRLGVAAEWRENAVARTAPPRGGTEAVQSVARALAGTFDCAVVAMRYVVEDEFAITLAGALYDSLFRLRQSLPQAIQRALKLALRDSSCEVGTLSLVMPALFGAKAAELKLAPPKSSERRFTVKETGLAYFPSEAEHFVGRVAVLTRASAALAAKNRKSGVLFYGMAGAGKSSCAVELAYHHEAPARFRAFVWYRAPEADKDISLALRDFALAMEKQLPGFSMVHIVDRPEAFKDWLPRLTEMLESNAVLVVLDNLETLLTTLGQWRDERWGWLIDALLKPGGLSRAVLTSRVRPADFPSSAEVIPVHALSRDEAVLLIQELPNLRRLLDGDLVGRSVANGRELVHRALRLVQGHPKLIELLEKLAGDPMRLLAQLDRAEATQDIGKLDPFFREGETNLDAEGFAASLCDWTIGIARSLHEAARTLFRFLCAIEEGDREGLVIKRNWAGLLKRLELKTTSDVSELLETLVGAGLVETKIKGADRKEFEVSIHPFVAEVGCADAEVGFRKAVDAELAETWVGVMKGALAKYPERPEARTMIVRAGLSAFPYLGRRKEWGTALQMLGQVNRADHSPATAEAILPWVRRAEEAASGTRQKLEHRDVLIKVLCSARRIREAEVLMLDTIEQAVERDDFRLASRIAVDLSDLLRDTGRLEESLTVIGQAVEYARGAGLAGPWTELWFESLRLLVFVAQGKYEKVLSRVLEAIQQMKELPGPTITHEIVDRTWDIFETFLRAGRDAANNLKKWQQVLDFNAQIFQSKQQRGESQWELARTKINDYFPLLALKRSDEVRNLLVSCREEFERQMT